MMKMIIPFAAFSMTGTVLLSLLPEGGLKRTAGMVIGILMLQCWTEIAASILHLNWALPEPATALLPTSITVEDAAAQAADDLSRRMELCP